MNYSVWWDEDIRLNLQSLVQKKVLNAFGGTDRLVLETSNGNFELKPTGDCCAICFIQHVDGSENLKDAVILEVEDIKLDSSMEDADMGDVTDVWGHRFHTTKGICTLEMRVDHNGYYGGFLDVEKITKFPKQGMKTLIDF